MTKQAAPKFTVKALSEKLALDSKSVRALVRKLAATSDSPRFRVNAEKRYEWNAKDFAAVVKSAEKFIEAAASECDARCTHSGSKDCDCHCNGANHGIHANV